MTSGQPPEHPYGERPPEWQYPLAQYPQPPYEQPQYMQAQYPPPPRQQPHFAKNDHSQRPAVDEPGWRDWRNAPREFRPVVALLAANLVLSVVLTVITLLLQHSLVDYQLDRQHVTDPALRESLRHGYQVGIVSRVAGNIAVSVVYVFLVRALIRGRRWAYRRVIWVGIVGAVALLLVQLTPYPAWMRIEQLLQAVVLALLVWFGTRPAVRAHFDPRLPGRNVRRFNR